MVQAAIYTRISSDRDDDRQGVDAQEEDCRRLCERLGWEVAEVYCDNDISAADPRKRRDRYQQMLRDIAARKVDAVAVAKADRLHRRPSELEEFFNTCDAVGLTQMASAAGEHDLSDPAHVMMLRNLGTYAAYEVATTKARIKRRKLQLAEKGLSTGGPRPFGYTSGDAANGELPQIIEHEAALIREAAERVLAGWTLYGIAKDWSERAVKTSKGNPWSVSTIRGMLIRPCNAGLRVHQKEVIGKAEWEPILDRSTWERVCNVLQDSSRLSRPRSNKRSYPLLGALTCSECGRALASVSKGGGTSHYGCRKPAGCGAVFVKCEAVEGYLLPILLEIADSPAARHVVAQVETADQDQMRTLLADNATDAATLERLTDDYADNIMDRETYRRQSARLRARVADRHERLAAIRGQGALGKVSGSVVEAWADMSNDERRAVVLALVSSVTVRRYVPRKGRFGGRFDPSRLVIHWNYDGLERIAEAEGLDPANDPAWQAERAAAAQLAENLVDRTT